MALPGHINLGTGNPGNQAQSNPEEIPPPSRFAFLKNFSVDAIKPYFDITEGEVFERMRLSVIPTNNEFFTLIEHRPDIFGPFWVLTTLIFMVSVAGNLAMWISSNGKMYDFNFIPKAATLIYFIGFVVPLALWGACKYLYAQA
jgi:hypothetical protein